MSGKCIWAALATLGAASGVSCSPLPDRPARISGLAVPVAIGAAAGVQLQRAPSAAIPSLEVQYDGGTPYAGASVLVFFSADAAQALASAPKAGPRTTALRRDNVVVLYTRAREAPDRTPEIRAALHGLARQAADGDQASGEPVIAGYAAGSGFPARGPARP